MKQKFYLTRQGLKRLEKEYKDLKDIRMAKTKGESPPVLHSEDLNPEYLAFKEDLTFLEKRITELEYILKNAELIKIPPKNKRDIIDLGAKVTLKEADGQINEFMIVGTLEANPSEGKISSASPIGKTLLGHQKGDQVVITSPIRVVYKVEKVKYQSI